jgi:hypothetical protein
LANDVSGRYASLIKQIAALYSDDPVSAQIEALAVIGEDWDDNRGGGHLQLQQSRSTSHVTRDTIECYADDEDGTRIEILLHVVDGRIDWAEWYRVDSQPITLWPPSSVHRAT